MLALLIRRQVLKTQDAKPADPCQRQRWSLNNDGFICLKGTPLVLALTESSNEVKDLDIFGFFMYRLISYVAVLISSAWEIAYIRAGWRALPYIAYTKTVAGDSVWYFGLSFLNREYKCYASSIQVLMRFLIFFLLHICH